MAGGYIALVVLTGMLGRFVDLIDRLNCFACLLHNRYTNNNGSSHAVLRTRSTCNEATRPQSRGPDQCSAASTVAAPLCEALCPGSSRCSIAKECPIHDEKSQGD